VNAALLEPIETVDLSPTLACLAAMHAYWVEVGYELGELETPVFHVLVDGCLYGLAEHVPRFGPICPFCDGDAREVADFVDEGLCHE